MSTQTPNAQANALQQPAVKEEAAETAPPPAPASAPPGGGTEPKGKSKLKTWLIAAAVVLVAAAGGFAWWKLTRSDVPEGFAQTNGRLEATKVYITTKTPLRVEAVLAKEGDYVNAGQVVVRMDTRTLQAQLRQAEAKIQQAKDAKATSVAQADEREAELVLAKSDLERSRKLIERGGASQQQVDVDTAKWKTAGSALQAARSQVVESQSAIDAAIADADKLRVDVEDGVLKAPRHGRIQYRLAEQGEMLPAGGRVLDMIDLTDVYMLFYLPEAEAGKATIGAEARLVFDALPDVVIPATVYFVAAEAQFTPKAVETRTERQKLAFQIRARVDPALLTKYEPYVRTGLPGVIYVRLDPKAEWPERLHVKIPEPKSEAPEPKAKAPEAKATQP
jgi:HlyD family secretion protein